MITMYSSSSCPACEGLKMKLNGWNLEYSIVQIDKDAEAKQEVLEQGFRTVPQLKVNGLWVKDLSKLTKEYFQ